MIDIEGTNKKVKQLDSLLTSIATLLKKHWILVIVLSIGALTYLITTLADQVPAEQIPLDSNIGSDDFEETDAEFMGDTISEEELPIDSIN